METPTRTSDIITAELEMPDTWHEASSETSTSTAMSNEPSTPSNLSSFDDSETSTSAQSEASVPKHDETFYFTNITFLVGVFASLDS